MIVTLTCSYSLISGLKNYIVNENVAHLHVPFYEGLRTEDILAFLRNFPEAEKCLPIEKEIPKLPKQWLINVAYTGVGEDFSKWVK